jgi:HPt (histidine-containing phosphotransfer) domain-containing protein
MAEDVALLARIQELSVAYAAALPGYVTQFQKGVASLARAADPDVAERERAALREIAHKLAGSAGLHGFPELSAWGKQTQKLCREAPIDALDGAARALAALVAAPQRG